MNPTTITPTTFLVTSGDTPIAGSFAFSNLNQTVLFIPNNPFPPVATVNLSISNVSDVVGNVMVLPLTSSFQTQSAVDNVRPSVVRPSPGSITFQPNSPFDTDERGNRWGVAVWAEAQWGHLLEASVIPGVVKATN